MCSLCGTLNEYAAAQNRRYLGAQSASLPELQGQVVEAVCGVDGGGEVIGVECQQIILAVIDGTAPDDVLEVIKESLMVALEASHPQVLFGILSFTGSAIVLHQPSMPLPTFRHVALETHKQRPCAVDLVDVLPLHEFLCPVGHGKDLLHAVISSMKPKGIGEGPTIRHRPVGEVIQSVLLYLVSSGMASGARLLLYLSGAPNNGRASVVADTVSNAPSPADISLDAAFPELTSWPAHNASVQPLEKSRMDGDLVDLSSVSVELGVEKLSLNWDALSFYENAGSVAASLGVSIDILGMSDAFLGLEMLEPLALHTGGRILLYDFKEEPTVSQDVYKLLLLPRAFGGMLRLRCCPELEVTCSLSERLKPDPLYEDVYTISACTVTDTFVLGLRLKAGFMIRRSTPVVQAVFKYLTFGQNGVLQRRMKILTHAFQLAQTPREVWKNCNVACIGKTLFQMYDLGDELMAWLQNLMICVSQSEGGKQADHTFVPDMPELQQLSRIVFAMLSSKNYLIPQPDRACFLRNVWRQLSPEELVVAVYPQLTSWENADVVQKAGIPLSKDALLFSSASKGTDLFLLDAFSTIILCGQELPSRSTLIRKQVDNLRQSRIPTPSFAFTIERSTIEKNWMIDDIKGYSHFLDSITQ